MLSEFLHRAVAWTARRYQAHTGKQLKKYGLLYEDTFIETPQVMQAIGRLPAGTKILLYFILYTLYIYISDCYNYFCESLDNYFCESLDNYFCESLDN